MREAYAYEGKKMYIATDFGDEVVLHPEGLDNGDDSSVVVARDELYLWGQYRMDLMTAEFEAEKW